MSSPKQKLALSRLRFLGHLNKAIIRVDPSCLTEDEKTTVHLINTFIKYAQDNWKNNSVKLGLNIKPEKPNNINLTITPLENDN